MEVKCFPCSSYFTRCNRESNNTQPRSVMCPGQHPPLAPTPLRGTLGIRRWRWEAAKLCVQLCISQGNLSPAMMPLGVSLFLPLTLSVWNCGGPWGRAPSPNPCTGMAGGPPPVQTPRLQPSQFPNLPRTGRTHNSNARAGPSMAAEEGGTSATRFIRS